MIIETWIAVLAIVFMCVTGAISLLGWMRSDKMLELERDINNDLHEEIESLCYENARLNSKINLVKLYVEEKTK